LTNFQKNPNAKPSEVKEKIDKFLLSVASIPLHDNNKKVENFEISNLILYGNKLILSKKELHSVIKS